MQLAPQRAKRLISEGYSPKIVREPEITNTVQILKTKRRNVIKIFFF